VIADQPPDLPSKNEVQPENHSSDLFSFSALVFLDLPTHTLSSSPYWDTAILCTQRCQYSPSCNSKSLQSSLQYISPLTVTVGKGFFSLGAKLWKGMRINQILFAKGQNFACKSLALNQ